jgi:hypothetical protein
MVPFNIFIDNISLKIFSRCLIPHMYFIIKNDFVRDLKWL